MLAKAGIQLTDFLYWILAYARMTEFEISVFIQSCLNSQNEHVNNIGRESR